MSPYEWPLDWDTLVVVPAMTMAYVWAQRRWPAPTERRVAFALSQLLVLAVMLTPVETIALHYLLSAHLLQNVVLAEWAPALVVLALPPAAVAAARRSGALRVLTHPLVALPLWLVTYYAWHVPAAYDTALRHPGTLLHLEHLCYFVTGVLMWWPVLTNQLAPGAAAGYLFLAFALASPLGLLLALIPDAVYGFYKSAPRIWGLGALHDQQLAGMTMAIEEAIVFSVAFAVYFVRFMRREESALRFEDARWTK